MSEESKLYGLIYGNRGFPRVRPPTMTQRNYTSNVHPQQHKESPLPPVTERTANVGTTTSTPGQPSDSQFVTAKALHSCKSETKGFR